MKSKQRIGLAFSGGGIRGIAHLGVIKALDEFGIKPDQVSGSSAGAIAGAMYCKGYKADEIFDAIVSTNYFKFMRPAISWTGIFRMDTVVALFEKYFTEDDFASLSIPLTVAATDIKRGKVVYFSKGPLIKAVMASSCIPGMFDPIEIDGRYYVDGGVLNNMPVEPHEGVCDVIIGVNCNHLPEEHNITNIKNLIERTVIMSMNYNVYSRKNKCDFFIEPKGLAKYGVFDIKKAGEIYDAGYQAALKFIEEHEDFRDLGKLA
ncbi:patatin-like phospholipase family protein [Belliella sp. DSM 111904]|uniref:Patatin-like phospholipase family protein n=1 Tax=Belliella filtrata TaxID=2923435 RepID=A0ABS9UWM3_9BACT|nr:patatin-like phospholipase family protein [Belliella filtrata]MCH7408566.1 patatin-like phospholipase family protein [Belliella filtrata]